MDICLYDTYIRTYKTSIEHKPLLNTKSYITVTASSCNSSSSSPCTCTQSAPAVSEAVPSCTSQRPPLATSPFRIRLHSCIMNKPLRPCTTTSRCDCTADEPVRRYRHASQQEIHTARFAEKISCPHIAESLRLSRQLILSALFLPRCVEIRRSRGPRRSPTTVVV